RRHKYCRDRQSRPDRGARLSATLSSRKKPGQSRTVEFAAQRFYSDVVEKRMRGEFRTRDQLHEAEAARIVVNDTRAGREVERDMIVQGIFRARAGDWA